jgi:hypothetical protein
VSTDPTTLLASLIGVVGVLSGLVVERLLRTAGRIWCEPTEWETHFENTGVDGFGKRTATEAEKPEDAMHAGYSVWLDLYNSKEVPAGLRDVSIVFSCDGGEELVSKPLSTTSGQQVSRGGPLSYATMRNVNLLPRQWITMTLHNDFTDPKDIRLMARWRRAEFVGQRHRRSPWMGRTYCKTIAVRGPS